MNIPEMPAHVQAISDIERQISPHFYR